MHTTGTRIRQLATAVSSALVLGTILGITVGTGSASAATPIVEPVERARAGEIVVFEVTPSSTGQLTVTAPTGSTVSGVFTGGCSPAGDPTVTCGTTSTVWDQPFYVGYSIATDAPTGPLPGGSVAFRAADGSEERAPVAVTVLPPWSADTTRGATVTVPLTIYGYGGTLRFTAPADSRITAVANAPSCVVAPDGASADCGYAIWSGEKDVTLQIDDDAPYGTLGRGTAAVSTSSGITSTPYTARVLPPAPPVTSVTASADGSTTLSGTAVDGALVTIGRGDDVLGSTTADDGRWTVRVPAEPAEDLSVTQRVADATSPSTATSVPLPTPTIDAPADDAEVAAGSSASGSAYPGSTVALRVDGDLVGTTSAGSDGSWTVALPGDLTVGAHVLVATARFNGLEERSDTRAFAIAAAPVPPTEPPTEPTPDPGTTPPVPVSPAPSPAPIPGGDAGSSDGMSAGNAPTGTGDLAFTGVSPALLGGGIGASLVLLVSGIALLVARRRPTR